MKGEARPIWEIFSLTRNFIIPIYQRRYSWKRSQCERLFDDIEDACGKERGHFIGCIITIQDGGMGDYLVIDGQQRITTILLLLKAMHDLLREDGASSFNVRVAESIRDDFLKNKSWEDERDSIKLNLLNGDKEDYFRLFDSDLHLAEDSQIHANYSYFLSRLKTSPHGFKALYTTIRNLQIVSITLDKEDNPQLIFESLNSTGLALTEGDKIRNFILIGLSSKDQVRYYKEYWSRIEENCGDDDTSAFVRNYLSLKTQKIPNIKNVYQEFAKYWEGCGRAPAEILEDMRTYSRSYGKLLNASTGVKEADAAITGLACLDTTVIRPFAMEVIKLGEEGSIPPEEVGKVFSIVESYIFRRSVCTLPTNALNKIFATLANDIRKLDGTCVDYSGKLAFVLLRKQGSGKFPSDEEFSSEFRNRNLYGGTVSRILWYILSKFENSGTLETKDVWSHLENGEYSIEHIMPQTLSDEWKADLGENWEDIHETWKNRLANLTLVAAPYNSMFSNNTFARKRDMEHGFRDSGLRLNQEIAKKDKWGLEELEKRSSSLALAALPIWPRPATSYKEPATDGEVEVSLDDDFDFTGRSLASGTFNDIPIEADDWADFITEVCKRVHETDPSGLATAARDAERLGLAVFLSDRESEGSRRISDSVHLHTESNTGRKILFLRKLFDFLAIDQDSLVMRVKMSAENEDGKETRRRLWAVIIPELVKATEEAGCPSFRNRKDSGSKYLDGTIGCSQMHLVSSVGFRSGSVWAYLYIDSGSLERNRKIFDFFLSHRAGIERTAGGPLDWSAPSEKARRGEILMKVAVPFIADETRWQEVANTSGDLMMRLVTALAPCIEEVKKLLHQGDL